MCSKDPLFAGALISHFEAELQFLVNLFYTVASFGITINVSKSVEMFQAALGTVHADNTSGGALFRRPALVQWLPKKSWLVRLPNSSQPIIICSLIF